MNNDHMQQAEKELSEEREMKLDFICKKCGSTEYEIKDKSNGTGIAHGLYCAKCGFWHKWIGKEELKRFSETKQKEKVYKETEGFKMIEILFRGKRADNGEIIESNSILQLYGGSKIYLWYQREWVEVVAK